MMDETLAVPHLVDSEIAHALRWLVARGAMTENAATLALERWALLRVTRFAARGLLGRVWALRENLSAYDATYVALAETLGCDLVTADARLSQSGPSTPMCHHRPAHVDALTAAGILAEPSPGFMPS